MNSVAGYATANTVTGQKQWSQPSQLFATLFGQAYMGRKVNILDIGSARPGTIEFFSQFKCRIQIVDIYSADFLKNQAADLSPKQLQKVFSDYLALPKGSAIDICLFWDIFNYLDSNYIKAFCAALKPHLHRATLGHGFGARSAETILADLEYSVEGVDSFSVIQRHLNRLPCYPLPQATLKTNLSCFSVERGTLFADGRQEMLLKAKL